MKGSIVEEEVMYLVMSRRDRRKLFTILVAANITSYFAVAAIKKYLHDHEDKD